MRSSFEAYRECEGRLTKPNYREEIPMFRKILIAAVASLSLLSPLALPSQSEAREIHRRGHEFRVYFRGCSREAWRCSGEYGCRADALRASHRLRERGFEVYVR
jgi:hypothetical protein